MITPLAWLRAKSGATILLLALAVGACGMMTGAIVASSGLIACTGRGGAWIATVAGTRCAPAGSLTGLLLNNTR